MYTGYFGLTERPFSIAPDPQYLYMSTRHKEAMAHLSYGLLQGGCFIVLTGEVGTGKTTLCRNLLSELPEHVDVALILNANINEAELLQTICDELKIEYEDSHSQKQLLDLINKSLLDAYADNRHTVLIIDEAQLLSRDVLEQIRLLTNLETTKHKLLQIILIGQPELNDLLSRNDLRQLAQRVTARYHLSALEKSEIEDYVNYRLGVAGCKQPLFSRQALSTLHSLTGGIPRKINVLADHALLSAYSKTQDMVSTQSVKLAAREVFISGKNKQTGFELSSWLPMLKRWAVPALGLVLLNIALWWWFAGKSNQEGTSEVISAPVAQASEKPLTEQSKAEPAEASQTRAEEVNNIPPVAEAITESEQLAAVVEPAISEVGVAGEAPESTTSTSQEAPQTAAADEEAVTVVGAVENPGSVQIADQFLTADPVEPEPASGNIINLDDELGGILETSADLTGRIGAFRNLSDAWGQPLPEQLIRPVCVELKSVGVDCLEVTNWQQLLRYNRPTILVLSNNKQLHRVILTSIDQDQATIQIDNQTHTVAIRQIRQRWINTGIVLWQPAELGKRFLQQGDSSSAMPVVRTELNKAFAKTRLPLLDSLDDTEFDLDMTQKVFALQSRFSIISDGKIGNETYLLLKEILQPETTPVLTIRVN